MLKPLSESVLFPSLDDWRKDTSTEPSGSQRRLPITAGRVARVERAICQGTSVEQAAEAVGLTSFVCRSVARDLRKRAANLQESDEGDSTPRDASKAKVRQEWIEILREPDIAQAPLMLLLLAESHHRARLPAEAATMAELAVQTLLCRRYLLESGKWDTDTTDPGTILGRLRAIRVIDKKFLQQCRSMLATSRWRKANRARILLSLGWALVREFSEMGRDDDKPARALIEAEQQYGTGKTPSCSNARNLQRVAG